MSHFFVLLFAQIAGYLAGGVPFGYLVARGFGGFDIRTRGSGNIGATNVGREMGFPFFLLVFALDFLKGAVPVLFAQWLQSAEGDPISIESDWLYVPEVVGLAAILGHIFPIYLGFKGGKGVATSIGVLLPLAPGAAIAGLIAFLALLAVTRMVSVGSIGFALAFGCWYLLRAAEPFSVRSAAMTGFVLVVSLLVIVKHRANLARVWKGTEPKIPVPWSRE